MGIVHYLNVLQGDCSFIQHATGHVSVIDVNNAIALNKVDRSLELTKSISEALRIKGNFQQKAHPVNPIEYLKKFDVTSIFRFILTHPDMDHMGGIKAFCEEFCPINFWDTANKKEMDFSVDCPYDEEDWKFYKHIRDTNSQESPKRLTLYAGSRGPFYNKGEDGNSGGDGLYILAPTPELIDLANETEDYNDSSYVVLYRAVNAKILFAGDSHNMTWEYILNNHEDDVKDIDLLIAPHHGRKSDRSYEFLDVLCPKLTFFGNANSEHLAYGAWNSRKLPFVTNNQANCMILDADHKNQHPSLWVTNETFAKEVNPHTFYSDRLKAYYCFEI